MKKVTFLLISSLLVLSVGCENVSKTSQTAPNNPSPSQVQTPNTEETQEAKEDAQSELRRRQLNEDIRAREQRNNITGGDTQRAEGDLESEVRSKLEANIPRGSLAVQASDDGVITVSGTVTNQQELAKIEPLAKEIKGVKAVNVKAVVAQPKS
ncbi:MAG: BON domain-containing protein [Pelatocladus maniniholoensis HA4357-MV3]|uniref:BON domain-containing protein n=1 Tax=Pelatocladus maniniholoensis HA4357-MV3 TaxID=1117104 RepID=A0A9E3LS64_9NOST|nr:BON domain-containing protein [Pelatocladus maniniholoensis HA4357-MV3]